MFTADDVRRQAIKDLPVIQVRIEPNHDGSQLVWRVSGSDGTKASGFAKCHGDGMRDAAAFVEAMAQPRLGGLWKQPELRVVGGVEPRASKRHRPKSPSKP